MSVTVTTYRVSWFDEDGICVDMSGDFNSAAEALKNAQEYISEKDAVVEKVAVTPLFSVRKVQKTTKIT